MSANFEPIRRKREGKQDFKAERSRSHSAKRRTLDRKQDRRRKAEAR